MPNSYRKYIIPELQKIKPKEKDEFYSYSSNNQHKLTQILSSDNSEVINMKGMFNFKFVRAI